MHPPQLPFSEDGPAEEIHSNVDKRGVLLDELGNAKHIAGAKFKGMSLWYLGEQLPGTSKYLVAWFDAQGKPHKLYVNEEPLTVDVVFRLRNKTHDGELSFFADVTTRLNNHRSAALHAAKKFGRMQCVTTTITQLGAYRQGTCGSILASWIASRCG